MSDFTHENTSEQARDYAQEHGLNVVVPAANQLFIDIDSDADYSVYTQNYDDVDKYYGIIGAVITPSRNKKAGRHIVVNLLTNVTDEQRILLQALLGSDRRREMHSLNRANENDAEPTLFFERRGNEVSPVPQPASENGFDLTPSDLEV